MAKQKYPKWFHHYSKPQKPIKPLEFITHPKFISKESVSSYDQVTIPDGAISIYIETTICDDYGGSNVELSVRFYGPNETNPNPDYIKALKRYEKALEAYEIHNKEWKSYKAIYDQEQEARSLAYQKKQYLQLKKKFDI